MGNHALKSLKSEEASTLKTKFNDTELHMLWLIYHDLAARHFGTIDKETFLKFFPLNGLWGEQLFKKFDLNHTGVLNFYEFASGMAQCCKSTEDEKIKFLFSLYDFDNDGFIEKKEMVTMLYNYPKNEIKFITDELHPDKGEKLEKVTEEKRLASLVNLDDEGPGQGLGLLPIPSPLNESIMEDSSGEGNRREDRQHQPDEPEIASENMVNGQTFPVERDIRKPYNYYQKVESNKKRDNLLFGSKADNKPRTLQTKDSDALVMEPRKRKYSDAVSVRPSRNFSNAGFYGQFSPVSNPLSVRKRSGSLTVKDPNAVQATTINTRVKEYASFMFRGFEGANTRGKLSFQEFREWLTIHPTILKVFENSFHEDLWNMNENHFQENGSLNSMKSTLSRQNSSQFQYRLRQPDLAETLYKKGKKSRTWKARYFELRGPFLFYYKRHGSNVPKGIFFLEGCSVEELNDHHHMHKYGFKISYNSESYEPHCLYTNHKERFDEWMAHLKSYKNLSIQDKYQFKDRIGTGKFSIVYRAISKIDNKSEFAVKVLEKGTLKAEEKEFILSETTVMKVLNHPSMIKLIEIIETKSNLYIVTELVKDGDLFEYIVGKDFLEEYEASYIMKQLFIAISYLHNAGIMHRDLKPENIMITLSSDKSKVREVKIIDFGFAHFIIPGVALNETCGTPNYVAPEVLKGKGYDKRADIWSLGIIMYLMLRGRLPFDSHNVNDILRNTMKMEVPLDEDHWDNISNEGKDLLLKLLERDVNKRISLHEALDHPWIENREKLTVYLNRNPHIPQDDYDSGDGF